MSSKRFFYIMSVLMLGSILSIVFAYSWGNDRLQAKSSEISDLIAERDLGQEKIVKLQQAQKDSAELGSINALLDDLLPKEKNQEELIADIIFTATSEAGIPAAQVPSFSFSGSSEPDDLSGTTLSTEVTGVYEYPFTLQIDRITYNTLLDLLVEIENNGRIIQVDNITISPNEDEDTNTTLLSVNLSMKAYLKP